MLYAVLDTNVIVSALLKKNSIPAYILEQAFIGDVIPVFSYGIINEYNNVLSEILFMNNTLTWLLGMLNIFR